MPKVLFSLQNALSGEEIIDCYDHFQLYYANILTRMVQHEIEQIDDPEQRPAAVPKHAPRNDKYWSSALNGPGNVAECFGLSAEHFAENLAFKQHKCVSDSRLPEEVALANLTQLFRDVKSMLEAAVYVVAYRLSREPKVRRTIRSMYRENALLRAHPTKRGVHEIDEMHPLYAKRYIVGKPLTKLVGAEYLEYHLVRFGYIFL